MYKLRELERKDLTLINAWRNDPELIKFLGAPYRFINQDVDDKWFDGYMVSRNTTVRCAVVTEQSDEILCLVTLADIDYVNQSAVFHIMIGNQENQGKGIGTFAVSCMINHAFYNMNLHRIELTVLSNNERAVRLYEKIGFVLEGRKRKCVYKNGDYIDMLCYAILRGEEKYDKSILHNVMGGGYQIIVWTMLIHHLLKK